MIEMSVKYTKVGTAEYTFASHRTHCTMVVTPLGSDTCDVTLFIDRDEYGGCFGSIAYNIPDTLLNPLKAKEAVRVIWSLYVKILIDHLAVVIQTEETFSFSHR